MRNILIIILVLLPASISFGSITIFPESYGAYGDNIHDDTTALNEAIKAAKDSDIIVGKGVYRVRQLNINKSLHLKNLTLNAINAISKTDKQDVLNISADDVTISNCKISINNKLLTNVVNESCLYALKVKNLKILNSSFDGSKNLSISRVAYGLISIHDSNNIIIENNKISNAHYEGLLLVNCSNASIVNVSASNCGNSGIGTAHGTRISIKNCNVAFCNASNISLNSTDSVVEDCISTDAGTWGINIGHAHSPANNSICTKNTIKNAGRLGTGNWGGIQMQSSSNVIISYNIVESSHNHTLSTPKKYNSGITIANKPVSCKIFNNKIDSQPGNGILIYEQDTNADITISNNSISNSYASGIYMHGGKQVKIEKNSITNSNRLSLPNHSGIWVASANGLADSIDISSNSISELTEVKQKHGILVDTSVKSNVINISNNSVNGWRESATTLPGYAKKSNNKTTR